MQTSQWNFAVVDVEKTIAATKTAMKITPIITGHFFFVFAITSLLVRHVRSGIGKRG
jgi:hypothetical protein